MEGKSRAVERMDIDGASAYLLYSIQVGVVVPMIKMPFTDVTCVTCLLLPSGRASHRSAHWQWRKYSTVEELVEVDNSLLLHYLRVELF